MHLYANNSFHRIVSLDFIRIGKQQEAGWSALLAAVMPSKGDGAGTDPF